MLRRDFLLTSGAGLAVGAGAAVTPARGAPNGANAALKAFMDAFAEDVLRQSPEQATFFGLDQGPRSTLKSRLNGRSCGAAARDGALCRQHLRRLATIDRSWLTGLDLTNYDCLVYANQVAVEGAGFPYGVNTLDATVTETATPYVVSQQLGAYATVPDFLDSQHLIKREDDVEAYVARLGAFAIGLDQETERISAEAAGGVILPDFLLETTISQLNFLRAPPAADTRLVRSVVERSAAAGLAPEVGQGAGALAAKILEHSVFPALARQAATLAGLRSKARSDAGVWKLPQGDAYYAWSLKVGTSTELSPQAVHDIGLVKVREISDVMDALLRRQGMSSGSVGERMSALGKDPRFIFPNTEAGKAQAIAYLNDLVEKVRPRAASAFNIQVKAPLAVKRVPPEIEAGAASGYEQHGSLDGARPAAYYLNLRDTAIWPKWALPTVTYHETIPGHVLQGAFVIERHRLPLARIVLDFNAYAEGWALYAEQMADELGLYEDDPFGQLGYRQQQLLRAARLVVDTGLHALRWSREQAIDWMVSHVGNPRAAAASEVDRYCSLPGQACGYMIGLTELNRLRAKTRAALGPAFDLRSFNDALLTSGSLPITLLSGVIDRFAAAGGRSSAEAQSSGRDGA